MSFKIIKNLHVRLSVLSIFSGLILAISWPPFHTSILILVAFVPILILERVTRDRKTGSYATFFYLYITILIWNLCCTSWLHSATPSGYFTVNILNALMQLLPFLILRWLINRGKTFIAYPSFAFSFVLLEYFSLNSPFAYPVMNLGNSLAMFPYIIQWYEITGALGGTLWVISINILIFKIVSSLLYAPQTKNIKNHLILLIIIIVLPCSYSLIRYYNYYENGRAIEVAIIHPNMDAKTEKYDWENDKILSRYITLTNKVITSETDYVIWPESAIPNAGWIEDFQINPYFGQIENSFSNYENLNIISGLIVNKLVNHTTYSPSDQFFTKKMKIIKNTLLTLELFNSPANIKLSSLGLRKN